MRVTHSANTIAFKIEPDKLYHSVTLQWPHWQCHRRWRKNFLQVKNACHLICRWNNQQCSYLSLLCQLRNIARSEKLQKAKYKCFNSRHLTVTMLSGSTIFLCGFARRAGRLFADFGHLGKVTLLLGVNIALLLFDTLLDLTTKNRLKLR